MKLHHITSLGLLCFGSVFNTSAMAQPAGFVLESPTMQAGQRLSEAQVLRGFGCEG
jgi:hypothetical protein